MGTIKSAMGIGGLLCLGIGDTIRVVADGRSRRRGLCRARHSEGRGAAEGRREHCRLARPAGGHGSISSVWRRAWKRRLKDCKKPLTVAVMGCIVNGPGEAREADVGIAGGEDCGVLFVHGEMREKLPYDELLPALLRYVDAL